MTRSFWRTVALLLLTLPACCLITRISRGDSGWARIRPPSLTQTQSRTVELLNKTRQKCEQELQDLLARHEIEARINPNGLALEFLATDTQRQLLFLQALDARIKQLSKAP
jgi:hypothetical protein